ncbi:hypothetical protein DPMN_023152 [Dreissena polymorpha]|uniref:Uncharacterized protein n=1 Tax=Dreissena polymorpha TaxID=45954 RepID=A0A9D4LM54_DREPO|nr:hypothetical protein DPMN_023152 [Dreissena polymorpha]
MCCFLCELNDHEEEDYTDAVSADDYYGRQLEEYILITAIVQPPLEMKMCASSLPSPRFTSFTSPWWRTATGSLCGVTSLVRFPA